LKWHLLREETVQFRLSSTLNTDGSGPGAGAKPTETRGNFAVNRNNGISGTSSSSFPASSFDMQEQMRDQMKDPAMQQMFTSMMKNMSTEMMANMSEQLGIKLSRRCSKSSTGHIIFITRGHG
jgi:hypothetical protein